ncbi:RHS repeat-associated core domain-containing protein [Amycolatopsis rhabdoformis]|uniref:RHS repeat-associated core domain-containing protein n=1 Tax=Amycolatopsis rhabdoformis TaxID=1448059 RepID=A0ABZ1IKB7_9PSEU|nr:RHS repeat-associated core domain-containing protein [Amycolatopsis rhabdoformis]WSE34917.1 RHS repeat-associated core domain-containing protein [Amycolatopsis rhabdoformis]
MTNPLIAPTQDSTKAYSGISLLETANDLSTAIESGDWASVAMGAVGTALDALSMAMDPFGAILAAGVSWLMEHVGPLKDALNGLTGNADQIKAQSETWANVAKELGSVASDLNDALNADLQSWTGAASDAYRQRAQDLSTSLQAAQKGCEGASSGVKTAGEVVAAVRTLVRDIISELIGHMISWALQVIFTLGIGLTWVVPQVVSAVAKTASQITGLVTKLVKALKALVPLLKKAGTLFEDAGKAFKGLKGGKVTPPPGTKGLSDTPKAPPVKSGGADSGGTKASGYEGAPKDYTPPTGKGGADDSTHASGYTGGTQDHTPPPTKSGADDSTHTSGSGGGTPPPLKTDGPPASRGLGGGAPATRDTPPPLKDQGENPRSIDDTVCVNDPIDVATGQMVLPEVDAEFAGTLPLVFERTHFSSFRAGRFFGSSWVSTVDQRLEVDGEGVSFASADGVVQRFRHPAVDEWTRAEQGPLRSITRLDNGGYLIDDAAASVARYFAPGEDVLPISAVSDRNGNRVEFDFDDAGVPLGLRHSGGYTLRVETTEGLVTGLFSPGPDGSEVELARYAYTDGRLTAVVNSSGLPFRYEYDDAGRVVAWLDRNESWYRYTFDAAGRCVRTEGAGGFLSGTLEYDTDNRITYSTDADGHRHEFHLNAAGQIVREVDPLGGVTTSEWTAHNQLLRRVDPLGRVTAYTYDEAGNAVRIVRPDGSEITFERTEFGLPLAMTEAPGVVTRWAYDERGNVLEHVDPTGAETVYTYDEAGNLTSVTDAAGGVTRIAPGLAGLPAAITDATGATTGYQRDQFGRTVGVVDEVGGVEQFGYTVSGAMTWHRRADGSVEQWLYDAEDNNRTHTSAVGTTTWSEITHGDLPSAQIRPDGTRVEFAYDSQLRLVAATDEQGRVWRRTYDGAGNLVRQTDFSGVSTSYRYDAAGQVVEQRTDGGQPITIRYDALGRIVERACGDTVNRYTYDPGGHLLTAENADSRVEFRRDAAGRVLAETVNGRTVFSFLDRLGRRVRRVTPSGAETGWEYGTADGPVAVRADGRTLRFDYDPAGRVTRRALDSGAALTQAWTPNSQLAGQTVTDPTGRATQQRAYRYRADGRLTGVEDQLTGPRSFALDQRGRVTGVQGPGWSEHYAYDAAGNVVDGAWPTATEQDALGPRSMAGTAVTAAGGTRYGHDAHGRMVLRRTAAGQESRFTWDFQNRLTAVALSDGTRWRYRYDALGRRIAKERLGPDGTTVLDRTDFAWDGEVLVEETRTGPDGLDVTVWDYEPDTFTPLLQRQRRRTPSQEWVDARFHTIVTDQAGAPAELVDEHGTVAWHAHATLWGGVTTAPQSTTDTPLRFQGQYFDRETGLHYNFHRYYDPVLARYLSPDPIGFEGGPNQHAFVENPHVLTDPLGLMPKACSKKGKSSKASSSSTHTSSANPEYKYSPGGSPYLELPPGGANFDKSNRVASGFVNPGHDHQNMVPHWVDAAVQKPPPGVLDANGKILDKQAYKNWLDTTQFHTKTNTGVPDKMITGHGDGVLGHMTSAGEHWNTEGMWKHRPENLADNRRTDYYHGIEEKHSSASSGSKDPAYERPGPYNQAKPEYWDQNHPSFSKTGGPWPSYVKTQGPALPPGGYVQANGSVYYGPTGPVVPHNPAPPMVQHTPAPTYSSPYVSSSTGGHSSSYASGSSGYNNYSSPYTSGSSSAYPPPTGHNGYLTPGQSAPYPGGTYPPPGYGSGYNGGGYNGGYDGSGSYGGSGYNGGYGGGSYSGGYNGGYDGSGYGGGSGNGWS